MHEHHAVLSLASDLAFYWIWFVTCETVVPTGGVRRGGGLVGMIAVLAGYIELSANFFARWDASYHFNAWAMPLGVFEKAGAVAVVVGIGLLVLANRATGPRVVASGGV